ncbi:MAG: IS21 family transposase [Chloroflexota bacterium]
MNRQKYGRLTIVDIETIIKLIKEQRSDRSIAATLGINRKSIAKIRGFYQERRELQREDVTLAELAASYNEAFPPKRPGPSSKIAVWEKEIKRYLDKGLTPRLIYQKLAANPAFELAEISVYRHVRKLQKPSPEVTLRHETKPGEESQVDFGSIGKLIDEHSGKERRVQVFVMVLSWSRHMYAEFVFDQKLSTWLGCHQRAFDWFGGVPERVKIDNLKSGISQACQHDPVVQQQYGQFATHTGFRITPCKPYTPKHKGKVERGGVKRAISVGYARTVIRQSLPPF